MSKFDASASAVGHLHQLRWALLELLRAGRKDKTVRVSLETYDDIALLDADGSINVAQQIKHHGNPVALTDGSEDLWKTLRVWLSSARLRAETGPRLYLLTTATTSEGTAVDMLRAENFQPELAAAKLTELAATLVAKGTERARSQWLQTSAAERLEVLRRVTIITNAPRAENVDQVLREELATGVRDEHVDLLIERLWGWWYSVALKVLIADRVETISAEALYKQLHTLRDSFLADSLPLDLSLVEVEDADIEEHRARPFVRQLDWIGVHGHNLRKAMVNYHRAYTQTAKWVLDGDLVEEDLTAFEKDLLEEWEIQFENMCDRLAMSGVLTDLSKQLAGRELFNLLYDTNQIRIRSSFTESFLPNGSRHMLADRGELGWHPDFRVRMEELLGVRA
ncbi:hypothetical protein MHM582_2552 [Microbacterium sp. HM58-2]|nr:hypothetical protein MHM582_2552 [Microbacterium sp. HM58-2]